MKNKSKKIKFTEPVSKRLDIFLVEKLKISRSKIQKLIADDFVSINNKLATKTGLYLKTNDEVIIEEPKIKKPASDKKSKTDNPNKREPLVKKPVGEIKIISKTEDYIVIEKPNGLLSHSTEKNEPDSVAAILLKKYPELKNVGEDPKRPGIVHRLDKEASGLLVVARTQPMFVNLKDQFKNRTVEKEYLVLVHGQVAKDWDEINFPIERSKNNDRMSARPMTERGVLNITGKNALTEFWVEKRFVNFTLLRVKIHTGRMHQIRTHLLAYNHPVVSDPLYFQKKRKDKWDKICGRLFLHCTKLAFKDLDGERQEFNSALPSELDKFLLLLK